MKLIRSVLVSFVLTVSLSSLGFSADAPAAPVETASSHFQIPATDEGLPGVGAIRRYDWFQKLWQERRAKWATEVQKDQGAVVFLGDSITQGWGEVSNWFPGVKVANRGISGDTTRGVLIRLQEDVIALHPKGVVLLIGTNDLEEVTSPENTAQNLKLIIAALREANPNMPVVLCAVFPSATSMRRPTEQIKKINSLYRAAVEDQPQVTYVDTFALFANGQGESKIEEMPDLLHPNGIGYAKWAMAIRPVLEMNGLVPAWPDDFTPETGFTSLFNGRDLSGWHYADAPALDGKLSSEDGRYIVRNGRLIVTVSKKERDYKKFWTTQTFPHDFILRLEFRCTPNADSGIYIREPQLQCRDYSIAGPFYNLKNYRPGQWNEIEVIVKGSLAHGTCNGEVLIDAFPIPADGPIGLESDHGQVEYRRIRIKQL